MVMNVQEIESRMIELETLFRGIEDDSEDFDDKLMTVHQMSLSNYLVFLAERSKTPYGQVFCRLREFLIPTLLDSYLRMNAEDRWAVLDLFRTHNFVLIALWSLLSEYRWRLQKSPAHEKPAVLQTGLLIAVLAEEYMDHVETTMILTSIWGDIEQTGLDPDPFFKTASDVAGRRKLTHGLSAQEILRDFEPYDYGTPIQR
jgi:hypothetical protein